MQKHSKCPVSLNYILLALRELGDEWRESSERFRRLLGTALFQSYAASTS